MKGLTLQNIAKAVEGELHLYDPAQENGTETEATSVVIDSRLAQKNGIFIATKGSRVDGHTFIPDMWEKGVLCVISEEAPEGSSFCPNGIKGNYILVRDSFLALKKLAMFYRSQLQLTVIGVTGSVGKTSTKEMIAAVLSKQFCVHKTEGNFNNEIGVPLTILKIREEHEVAVMEMGISDFGEMTRLAEMARPDHCVITNIGPCHLEFLGDLDGVLRAKTEIFKHRNPNGEILLNAKDAKLRTITEVDGKSPIFFGSEDSQVYATDIKNLGLEGSDCTIHTRLGDFAVRVPLPGLHMVDNALCATAAGIMMGMNLEMIRQGIESVTGMRGRSNLIKTDDYMVVDDCYNANPKAMCSAIDLLCNATGRKVAILGDMFELGENSPQMHASVGEYAKDKVDVLIACGELSENIYQAAKDGKCETYWYATKEELLKQLTDCRDSLIQKGDTILIKASHGMDFAKIVEVLTV